jgi:hypothetical protein
MRPTVRTVCSLVLGLAVGGCLGNTTPVGRVQEAAQELNTASRFGRMDIALDRVARDARDGFAKRHAAWGAGVRVMEAEVSGVNLKDKEHADLFVTVSWQKLTESDMRSTVVLQRWKDEKGTWRVTAEERASGDWGLFGEAAPAAETKAGPKDVQFQTVYIR